MPLLGDWRRGEQYSHDILNNFRNWAIGWTDWNLALDQQGGPNRILNFVDAAIIVNSTGNSEEYYQQPMYFHLGHFSRFVLPGSVRIDSQLSGPKYNVST